MTDNSVEILLVEDNPNDMKLTLHALQKNKLANNIHVVRDGVEALEFIFCTDRYAHRKIEHGPTLVLLDLKLPLVDGMEVLRAIRADARTRLIPVVMLTSSNEDREVIETDAPGVNRCIAKPMDFGQFNEVAKHHWLLLNRQPPSLNELSAEDKAND